MPPIYFRVIIIFGFVCCMDIGWWETKTKDVEYFYRKQKFYLLKWISDFKKEIHSQDCFLHISSYFFNAPLWSMVMCSFIGIGMQQYSFIFFFLKCLLLCVILYSCAVVSIDHWSFTVTRYSFPEVHRCIYNGFQM